MVNRITYQINEEEGRVVLKVSVQPRFVNREDVTVFDNQSAEKILLDNNIKYDTIISSPNSILSNKNKGSTTYGEWVFSRKKAPVATKKTTRTKRKD